MRKLVLMVGLVVVVFACSEPLGEMLMDGGQAMMDAGDAMQPDAGAQDTPATCDKSETSGETTVYWAEFPVTPGETEITYCFPASPGGFGPQSRAICHRTIAPWFEGTSTGHFSCNLDPNAVTSITVHN